MPKFLYMKFLHKTEKGSVSESETGEFIRGKLPLVNWYFLTWGSLIFPKT